MKSSLRGPQKRNNQEDYLIRRVIFMISYIWPIALVIASNILYQICAKSVPKDLNPFASLIVTYLVGAVVSAIFYFINRSEGSLVKEFGKLNWAS